MTEQELLKLLLRYPSLSHQHNMTISRLTAMEYKITPSYGNTGGGRASGTQSKVEDYVTKIVKLKRDEKRLREQLETVYKAIACPDLTFHEKGILEWIMEGRKLATYAEMEGIYSSRVYKLRDRALKKAVNYIMQDKMR